MKDLICPLCHKKGFESRHVWYPEQPESNLKCSACGEWSQLKDWTGPGVFKVELSRARTKYSPELWAKMHPQEMHEALFREVDELKSALWKGDLDGEHGIIRESIHVMVVAQRIQDEMRRRANL